MKKGLIMVLSVLVLAFPCAAGQREDALLNGFLGLGARAMELQAEKAQTPPEHQPEPATASEAAEATPPAMPLSLGLALRASLKPALDGLVEQYKEQYKAEGRAYAREVGDIVVARVAEDEQINATITSLRTLCWAVVAYLTLVTLVMLGCLIYLRRANERLLAEVRRMARALRN